jgi:hypothetical protein
MEVLVLEVAAAAAAAAAAAELARRRQCLRQPFFWRQKSPD